VSNAVRRFQGVQDVPPSQLGQRHVLHALEAPHRVRHGLAMAGEQQPSHRRASAAA